MGRIEAIAYIADNQAKAKGILKRVEKSRIKVLPLEKFCRKR
ncbi:hypothetical protein B0P06_005309 [Clostridium saccharoperbutylacetonicum]|nr:hypothetical protein [Clostridium saccharoperbutylacetonicum]NRT62830.1 hypothetical protein [Clostridium saccharoperbutylacetonicum]NSB26185.1 hypothetical protein [Clostridium saccharoperbutylacetonicum]NSB45538.1 hypothetical protein [Clostridium saccharoperbutylacetonicum]